MAIDLLIGRGPTGAGDAAAIRRTQAVIEFDTAGTILEANEIFLRTVGYAREEVVGKHHRIFVEPEIAASADYGRFWTQLAGGEAVEAQRGGAIVGEAVSAMERIETASRDIAEIVTVIDAIAFQTNLLALNAAAEAARAGDAGKGFAVVASEVRALAQRSSDSANDIKKLISNSTLEVSSGVKLVKDTGAALSDIVDASTLVAEVLADISEAAREQANGIDEIAKVVAHMDDITQQNASMAVQSASASQALERATQPLREMVAAYRTDGEAGADLPRRVVGELPGSAPHLAPAASSVRRAGA